MIIKEYIISMIYGVLLGYTFDRLTKKIAERFKLNNTHKTIMKIICVLLVIYAMEHYVCDDFTKWRNTGCGTLFFVSFFGIQLELYKDVHNLLTKALNDYD